MQKELLQKPQVAQIGEHIGFDLAEEMIKKYFDKHPDEQGFFIVGKDILEKILNQPDCVGITLTPALDSYGKKTFVFTGVDASGNPILKLTKVSENGDIFDSEAIIADKIGNEQSRTFTSWQE